MSDVTITVRGEHETRVSPERATIRLAVRAEGAARASVIDRAMSLTEPVRGSIKARSDAGSVIDWSSTRLTVRAERPWNNEGRQLDLVYYASVDLTATFAEASELSIWVTEISPWDGVEVGEVDWHLTPETTARTEAEVAARAVGVAVARAQAYATALGRGDVVPLEVADAGLLAPPATPPAFGAMAKNRTAAFSAASDTSSSMQYEPQEIVISATVEARFIAR
nr:SIMPL domain-containing protein [uncultured Microbacterium sp.]